MKWLLVALAAFIFFYVFAAFVAYGRRPDGSWSFRQAKAELRRRTNLATSLILVMFFGYLLIGLLMFLRERLQWPP
jgi:hypothetical protein